MTNESLIQVPSNIAEPLVLQRFLLRLVEELDIVLGKRGSGADAQYVAQKELIAAGVKLQELITAAQKQLDETLALVVQETDDTKAEVEDQVSDQGELIAALSNSTWARSFTASFPGRNTNGLVTPHFAVNVASVERTSVGAYRITLANPKDAEGDFFIPHTQCLTSYSMTPGVSSIYEIVHSILDVSLGVIVMNIYSVQQGAGVGLNRIPHDPASTDIVNTVGMYTPTSLVTP